MIGDFWLIVAWAGMIFSSISVLVILAYYITELGGRIRRKKQ